MRGSGGGNPRPEADFKIRSLVSSYREREGSGKASSPLPGGLPPPGSPADCDWGRDGQPTPACPPLNFHRSVLRPAPLRMARAIVCGGVQGVQPPAQGWEGKAIDRQVGAKESPA